jgi:type II secretory pathway pseudopilin PulG
MTFSPKKPAVKGFSLVEMVIYVFILTLLLYVIVSLLTSMASTQRRFAAARTVESSMILSLERAVREIRGAVSIDQLNSVFNAHPGVLALIGEDAAGNPRAVRFEIINGTIHIIENGVDSGPITQEGATIESFILRQTTTSNSLGIKIELTVSAGVGAAARTESISTTASLRGSY